MPQNTTHNVQTRHAQLFFNSKSGACVVGGDSLVSYSASTGRFPVPSLRAPSKPNASLFREVISSCTILPKSKDFEELPLRFPEEDDGPAEERARPTRHARVVEEETNADGTEDLGEPIAEVVQRSSTDVE